MENMDRLRRAYLAAVAGEENNFGDLLIEALKEALAYDRGEISARRVVHLECGVCGMMARGTPAEDPNEPITCFRCGFKTMYDQPEDLCHQEKDQ